MKKERVMYTDTCNTKDYMEFLSPHGYIAASRDVSVRGLWRLYKHRHNARGVLEMKFLGYAQYAKQDAFKVYQSFIKRVLLCKAK